MPFTLAHPAAVMPLHRLLGRRTSLSALIIGSMAPDFVYFVPLGVDGRFSHSLDGLVWFCIPAAVIAYALFHVVAKRPLAALLPDDFRRRLSPALLEAGPGKAGFVAVVLSIALGAFTHIAWDAFTHGDTPVVRSLEVMREVVVSVGGYDMRLYKLLQHMSSAIGLVIMARWVLDWRASTPLAPESGQQLGGVSRRLALGWICLAATSCSALLTLCGQARSVEGLLVRMTVGALAGTIMASSVYCMAWHARLLIVADDRETGHRRQTHRRPPQG